MFNLRLDLSVIDPYWAPKLFDHVIQKLYYEQISHHFLFAPFIHKKSSFEFYKLFKLMLFLLNDV